MQNFWTILNNNSPAVQAISTVALVAITIYYAVQTSKTVKLMKHVEGARIRPRVIMYIKQREDQINLIDLYVSNNGGSAAKDVTFKIEKDLLLLNNNDLLSQRDIIKDGINILPANDVVKIPLLFLIGRLDELKQYSSKVNIEYSDIAETKRFREEMKINFKGLVDHQIGIAPLAEIAKNTESINSSIKSISRELSREQNGKLR